MTARPRATHPAPGVAKAFQGFLPGVEPCATSHCNVVRVSDWPSALLTIRRRAARRVWNAKSRKPWRAACSGGIAA